MLIACQSMEPLSLLVVDAMNYDDSRAGGLFVFKKKRLQDVLDILSRWYDVDVFYQNLDLQDLHFTGTIQRHSNIADVLKFLEKTNMVKFTLKGRTLIVSK